MSQRYLKIVPIIITNIRRDIEFHTKALLDTGSDTSLIRKVIADILISTRRRRTINVSNGVTNTRKASQTNKCNFLNIDYSHVTKAK